MTTMNKTDVTTPYIKHAYSVAIKSGKDVCNSTISGYNVDLWLNYKSDEQAFLYLPIIIYLLVIALLGVLGNIIVIYIYGLKYKRQESNHYIVTMAVFDLLAVSIVIPIDIYDLRYHYTFYNAAVCKIFRYGNSMTTFGSALILVVIAFDRYWKICRPLNPFHRTKLICVSTSVLAVILASPAVALFGISYREVPGVEYCGYDCTFTDRFKRSVFRKIYFNAMIFVFIVTFILMISLYIRIWLAVRSRRRTSIGETSLRSSGSNHGQRTGKGNQRNESNSSENDSVFTREGGHISIKMSDVHKGRIRFFSVSSISSKVKCSRTTKIFVAVSIAFVLSFLPSIAVNAIQAIYRDIDTSSSKTVQILLKLFARSYFINNAINPVIYSFLNVNFRVHCYKSYRNILQRLKVTTIRNSKSGSCKSTKRCMSETNKSDQTKEYELEHLKAEMNSRK